MGKEYTRAISVSGSLPISGQVLYHNDFENHVDLVEAGSGGDTIFELDPNLSFSGAQSLHLSTRVTGITGDDFNSATLLTPLPVSKQPTLDFRFRSDDFNKMDFFVFSMIMYDGVSLVEAGLKWSQATNELGIIGAGGVIVPLVTLGAVPKSDMFHHFQLSFDMVAKRYFSVTFDGIQAFPDGQVGREQASTVAPHLAPKAFIEQRLAAQVDLWLDEFVVIDGRVG